MRIAWTYVAYIVLVTIIAARFARGAYLYLARFRGWESPWKRLLAISPILLAFVFMFSGIYMVLTK